MGIFIGVFGLILGIIFLFFPKVPAKIFLWREKPGLYVKGYRIKKEGGFERSKSMEEKFGKKGYLFFRILGVLFLIFSVYAFISNNIP